MFKRLFPNKAASSGAAADASATAPELTSHNGFEFLDLEVRLVQPSREGSPQVWTTRTLKGDDNHLYLLLPDNWNHRRPPDPPMTLYVTGETTTLAGFDSQVVTVQDGPQPLLRVARPASLPRASTSTEQARRRQARVEVNVTGEIRQVFLATGGKGVRTDEPRACRMVDLSVEGCQLLTNFGPPVQQMVEITLPGSAHPLQAQGVVVRVSPSTRSAEFRYSVGVSFQSLLADTRKQIAQYLIERTGEGN